jgi:predicted hydrocarbon binding protein
MHLREKNSDMSKEERHGGTFSWKDLGNIGVGRPNLGPGTTVMVYRLMQYTLRATLVRHYGDAVADRILSEAGYVAGAEFCKNMLDTSAGFDSFVADWREKLEVLSVGILRFEKSDTREMDFTLTISEDLDCSGLPVSGVTVCAYDEGFIAGVFGTYTGREFDVKEIDCWATGERTCRFRAVLKS